LISRVPGRDSSRAFRVASSHPSNTSAGASASALFYFAGNVRQAASLSLLGMSPRRSTSWQLVVLVRRNFLNYSRPS